MTSAKEPGLLARLLPRLGVLALLIVLAAMLTYVAGGTQTPIPHAFYLPVVVAAGSFGVRAGALTAVVAGLACGPLMPLNTSTGELQSTSGWLVRTGFFVAIGLVVGVGRNRLVELVRARQDFLSVVSHELRTPLASVLGFAALLQEKSQSSDDETREFVDLIHKEATELSNVVDHYVVEGRLKDSALFIDPRPTDVTSVLEIVLGGIPAHVRADRIRIEDSHVICRADPLRLRQILRSMINNALAYTPGPLRIVVASDHSYGEVTISDDAGDRAGRPRFSPMPLPASKTYDSVDAPLGIGLAVSRDLARRMGGELQYDVNGSTSLHLRLPVG